MTWIVASFSYFMTYFQIRYLTGDVFVNTIAAAVSEMMAHMISGILYDKLGIKGSYFIYFLIGSIGSILYLTVGTLNESVTPYLLFLAEYGISSSCMMNWLSNARLFPVIYASTTNGIASIFARFSNILAP